MSINKENLTHEFISASKIFSASILTQDTDMKFIGNFGFKSGRDIDKFKDVNYKQGITGVPIVLDNSAGYLEAEVINSIDVGTHTVFIGKVVAAEIIGEQEPMTYAYYHQVKRGVAPKTAPTYIPTTLDNSSTISPLDNSSPISPLDKGGLRGVEEKREEVKKMDKYKCTICGYVYEPEKGDTDSGIQPGTPFDKLPEDWVCPVCGADKSAFEKED